MSKMIFHSDKERNKCETYLGLKGIDYHIVLANFVGLNKNGKIEYKKVANLYQYDKRIRNIIYKFISAFEEGIRAFICNKYNSQINSFEHIDKTIYAEVMKGSSLSNELESLDFNKLVKVVLKLSSEEKLTLFRHIDKLSENLKALKELRNTVSHHRLLFVYEDFEPCFVNNVKDNSLQANLLNLYNLLNPYYKEFFKSAINDAIKDKDDKTFANAIPKKAILNI